jgi:hypothetical protein
MEGKVQLHLLRIIFLLFSLFKPLALALRLVMDGMNHNGSPSAVRIITIRTAREV